MWLINTQTLKLEYFPSVPTHDYAILSHTWAEDEVLFNDMDDLDVARLKKGWHKVQETCRLAREESLSYAWIDTCCIDKSSSAELSEAINSMFEWYSLSRICFAHLADLEPATSSTPSSDFEAELARCRWFTRGWTLQELICPWQIHFLDKRWSLRGTKALLQCELASITGVDVEVLQRHYGIFDMPVARRMSYAAQRVTTRAEDMAYCLLGIFQVHMPLLYGEGAEEAFHRLQEQIVTKRTFELSIFAWKQYAEHEWTRGIFADSPAEFKECRHVRAPEQSKTGEVSVYGTTLTLNEPAYHTPSPPDNVRRRWREEINLDLNLIECSARTDHQPLWVTVPLERTIGCRSYRRAFPSKLAYHPTRPWIYTLREPKPSISLQKTHYSPELPMDRSAQVTLRFHENMQHLLLPPQVLDLRGQKHPILEFYICPFRAQGLLHPCLATFAAKLDFCDSPITILFLYMPAPSHKNDEELKLNRRASMSYINPDTQPDYHHSMQKIRASMHGYEAEVTQARLGFDFVFQHLHKDLEQVVLYDTDDFETILEIEDEANSAMHRFIAKGSVHDPGTYRFDKVLMHYERVELKGVDAQTVTLACDGDVKTEGG